MLLNQAAAGGSGGSVGKRWDPAAREAHAGRVQRLLNDNGAALQGAGNPCRPIRRVAAIYAARSSKVGGEADDERVTSANSVQKTGLFFPPVDFCSS